MTLAIDATTTAAITGGTSTTLAHTCTGSNLVLLVRLSGFGSAVPTAVTYNAVGMTKVADSGRSGGGDFAQIWQLINPATGAHNIVVTHSSGGIGQVSGKSFSGADQTTPTGTAAATTGSSTAPSGTVTSASGEIVIDCIGWDNGGGATASAGGGQTADYNVTAGGEGAAGSFESGAASVVMSWTLSVSTTWASAAIGVKPVAAAAPDHLPFAALTVTPPIPYYMEI